MCKGNGKGNGVPVPVTMTEQTNTFRSTKLMVKLIVLILYFTSGVTIGTIYKDKISKLFGLSVLFSQQKGFFAWTIIHRQRIS